MNQLSRHPAAKPLSDNRDQGDELYGSLFREWFVCMDNNPDLNDVGPDEQAAFLHKVYESTRVDSLIRRFDASIGDNERLITYGVRWESGDPSTTV